MLIHPLLAPRSAALQGGWCFGRSAQPARKEMIDSRTGGSTTTSGHTCRSQQGLELRYMLHICERLELPSSPLAPDSMMSWKASSGQRGGIVYERLRNESGPHVTGGTWGEGGQPAPAPRRFFIARCRSCHAFEMKKKMSSARKKKAES